MVSGRPLAAPAEAATERAPALATGLAWAVSGQAAAALGLLAGFRLLTEILPPAVFGMVSLLAALATFARSVAGFPVLQAALRHYPEWAAAGRPGVFAAVMRHELLCSAGLGLAIILATGIAARLVLGTGLIPFVLAGGFLAADLARNFLLDLLNATRQHARYAAWAAAEAWVRPLLGVLAAMALGAAVESVLAGYLLAACVLAVLMAPLSPLRGAPSPSTEVEDARAARRELRRSMRDFARPLAPLALFAWLTSAGDRYVVAAFSGPVDVGLYAAMYGLVSVPFVGAQGVLELAFRPSYFAAASAGDKAQERRLFGLWTALAAVIAAAGMALVAGLHETVAALALGPAYRAASTLMPPIALGLALWLVGASVEKACYAHKRTRWVLAAQGVGAAAFLALTPPLVRAHGAAGAAAAVPLYFGLQLAASAVAARAALRRGP